MALSSPSRNGKTVRIALFAAMAAFGLLMLYLHQRARSEADALQRVLEEAHVRHSKLTSELKGEPFYVLLQGYTLHDT